MGEFITQNINHWPYIQAVYGLGLVFSALGFAGLLWERRWRKQRLKAAKDNL